MKDFLLALKLFAKNYKINLLFIIQVVISSLILLSLFGKIQGIERAKSATDVIQTKNAIYVFMHFNTMDDSGNAPAEFYNAVQGDNNKNTIGEIRSVYCRVQDGNNIPSLAYNESLISNVHLKLQEGSWFPTQKTEYIPIISVGNQYKLNETIKFSIDSQTVREGRIIGIMDKNSVIITFNSGASRGASSLSYLTTKAESCLIIPEACLSDKEKILSMSEPGKIVFKPENSDTSSLQNVLAEYGAVSNMEDLKRNFTNENSQFMIANGTAFLFF